MASVAVAVDGAVGDVVITVVIVVDVVTTIIVVGVVVVFGGVTHRCCRCFCWRWSH